MGGLRAALVSTCVVLPLSIAGCDGDPPDREVQQAQAAVAAARSAGADLSSADEIAAAAAALQNANAAIEQHDDRLAPNPALDSRERAEDRASQAIDGRTAARARANAALQGARGPSHRFERTWRRPKE
jgi:predicted exporter